MTQLEIHALIMSHIFSVEHNDIIMVNILFKIININSKVDIHIGGISWTS